MRSVLIALVLGCGGTPPTPARTEAVIVPSGGMIDAAVAEIVDAPLAIVADAALAAIPIDAAPVEPLVIDSKRPAVKGPVTKLAVKASATIGGVLVKFISNGHKHPAGRGRSLGMWGFEIVRGSARLEFELRDTDEGFEAEVDAKGVLLVFRHLDYDTFEIVLAAKQTPKPLDEDGCMALIAKEAARKKLPDETNGYGTEHGFVNAHAPRWNAHCGIYTRRVWFTAKRSDPDAPAPDN